MGGGIKNKWTTGLPGNIQNYNVQAFLSTDCGPHILHTQLPLAPALDKHFHKSVVKILRIQIDDQPSSLAEPNF